MGSIQLILHGQASFGTADYEVPADRGRQQGYALSQMWKASEHEPIAYVSGELSGQVRQFVGGSGPGGGVAEVQAAGAVQGDFGEAGELAVG